MKHIPKKDSKQENDFTIQFSNSAEKSLDKIPFSEFTLIDKEIKSLILNPKPLGCARVGKGFRIRTGKYRILYFVDENNRFINILDVLKRNDAYKKKSLSRLKKKQ